MRKNRTPQETWAISELLQYIAKEGWVEDNSIIDNPDLVSVQINGQFISKEDLKTKEIKPSDELDYLYFLGGGY